MDSAFEYLLLAMALTQRASACVQKGRTAYPFGSVRWWKTCLIASIAIQLQTFTIIIPSVLKSCSTRLNAV